MFGRQDSRFEYEIYPADDSKYAQTAPSQGIIHEAMLAEVKATVRAGTSDKRRTKHAESKTWAFDIRSPLLGGKAQKNRETCMTNLPPFWAVLRCPSPNSEPNMELVSEVFGDPGFAFGGKFPHVRKGLEFSVELPFLRNVTNIEKGEVLCLPFFQDD